MGRGLSVVLAVVSAAFGFASTAVAAPPVVTSVSHVNRHPAATRTLPSGVKSQVAEIATSPATSTDGYFFFENVRAFDTLEDAQTTWVYDFELDPGTYYVHVGGIDDPCFLAGMCPVREFSQIVRLVIGASPPPPPKLSRTTMPLRCCGISYPIWNKLADRQADFDELEQLGVSFVRLDSLVGNAGSQDELDKVVAVSVARRITPQIIFGGVFSYASRPTLSAFEMFGRDQAAKYRGAARVFEVLNEPDLHGWTPTTYTPYLKAAYRGVKAGNPNAVVSTGGIWKWNTSGFGVRDWVRGLYANGAKGSFDALALHLYDDPFERGDWNIWDWAFVKPDSARAVMDANGDVDVPIWSSENGGPVYKYGLDGQARIARQAVEALKTFPVAVTTSYTLGTTT